MNNINLTGIEIDNNLSELLVETNKMELRDLAKLVHYFKENRFANIDEIVMMDISNDSKIDLIRQDLIDTGLDILKSYLIITDTEDLIEIERTVVTALTALFVLENMDKDTADIINSINDDNSMDMFLKIMSEITNGSFHNLNLLIVDYSNAFLMNVLRIAETLSNEGTDLITLKMTVLLKDLVSDVAGLEDTNTFRKFFTFKDGIEASFNSVYHLEAADMLAGNNIEEGKKELLASILLTEEGRNDHLKMIQDYVEDDINTVDGMGDINGYVMLNMELLKIKLLEIKDYEQNGILKHMLEEQEL